MPRCCKRCWVCASLHLLRKNHVNSVTSSGFPLYFFPSPPSVRPPISLPPLHPPTPPPARLGARPSTYSSAHPDLPPNPKDFLSKG